MNIVHEKRNYRWNYKHRQQLETKNRDLMVTKIKKKNRINVIEQKINFQEKEISFNSLSVEKEGDWITRQRKIKKPKWCQ